MAVGSHGAAPILGFFLRREAAIVFLTVVTIFGFREFARATATVQRSDHHRSSLSWNHRHGRRLLDDQSSRRQTGVVRAVHGTACLRDRRDPGDTRISQPRPRPASVARLAIVGFVYFGWMFGHVAFLANSAHAYSYLGYLVVAVELNDIAAYASGKLFGRHPLRSNISPKKTWEGAAGGLTVSLLLPWILLPTFPHFEKWDCLLAGLIVGVGGRLGDLVVSVLRRDLGIKDMGR